MPTKISDPVAIDSYKLDPAALEKSHVLTAKNDDTATKWTNQLLSGVGLDGVHTLLKVINEFGGTSLDVGMSYGAQYFGLKHFYPKIVWSGVDIAQGYLDKFAAQLSQKEVAPTYLVNDYSNMSIFANGQFSTVTARSFLSYYPLEKAIPILDEMLRIASKAVIVKFYQLPNKQAEEFFEPVGNRVGRGYFVDWALADWGAYLETHTDVTVQPYENPVERQHDETQQDFGVIPADVPQVQVLALVKQTKAITPPVGDIG